MIDIKELRRLSEAATQGEWKACGADRGGCQCGAVFSLDLDFPVADTNINDEMIGKAPIERVKANSLFIAAANPSAILSLLDHIERQEALIAELRKDAERLDYVLCNGRPLKYEFMYRYQCKGTMNWHDDPRDAIDAAMEADKWIESDASTQEVG